MHAPRVVIYARRSMSIPGLIHKMKLFYVVDNNNHDKTVSGPHLTKLAANDSRNKLEAEASPEQNEKWNLWIVEQEQSQ